MTVAALYVQRNGCYWNLPDVDPWDIERDARKYAGPWPVVAHPPCARWCLLAGLVEARYPHLKRGHDEGCFESALAAVRTYGGVLEHPAYTRAFDAFGLPHPLPRGWQRTICGGWVAHVDQGHYGHKARKPTWLYAITDAPPPLLTWGRSEDSSAAVSLGFPDTWRRRAGGEVQQMSKRERAATPIPFRDLLLSIARSARVEERAA